MQKLVVMVGLPGSGKSTYVKSFLEYLEEAPLWKVISSDQIREELWGDAGDQSANDLVFREFYRRMNLLLAEGFSVILDATNTTLKSRSRIFSSLTFKGELQVEAWIMNTPLTECIAQDRNRDRAVGIDVIKRFQRSFQVPQYFEGFDEIKLCGASMEPLTTEDFFATYILLEAMREFDQNNPHHDFTVGEHCSRCADLAGDQVLWTAGRLHDVGKMYTKTLDEQRISHYYSHAEVGTYYLLSHPKAVNVVYQYYHPQPLDTGTLLEILFYVNYHMLAHTQLSEKSTLKYKKLFGEEGFKSLMTFGEWDRKASKSSN